MQYKERRALTEMKDLVLLITPIDFDILNV